MTSDALAEGRAAYGRRAWAEAYRALAQARTAGTCSVDDVELLARAAFLSGRDLEASDAWQAVHRAMVEGGDAPGAARAAFWCGFVHANRGETAAAAGWFRRGRDRLSGGSETAEHGWLLIPDAIAAASEGAPDAEGLFIRAAGIAERFGDHELEAMARAGSGRVAIRRGDAGRGLELMDQAMVTVMADVLSPIVTGDVYCTVIEGCFEAFDLRRASEWTAALERWCDAQPDLVPFRGECLLHRTEILQIHGSWSDAMANADLACERLREHPMLGAAFYQVGELQRLRGAGAAAEDAYRRASRHGRDPQPGLALLRVQQGRVADAAGAIRRILETTTDALGRAQMLPAAVEIRLAADDPAGARDAAEEAVAIAAAVGAPMIVAAADHATAAVLLASGDAAGSCAASLRAREAWLSLDAPYELARSRVLLGLGYREMGDHDAARMELDAALRVFRDLGARPEIERAERLAGKGSAVHAGLTPREAEVLILVARGRTNRDIAEELVISEKTVARHLSNIFGKLGLSSRSAATAYAYEQRLV